MNLAHAFLPGACKAFGIYLLFALVGCNAPQGTDDTAAQGTDDTAVNMENNASTDTGSSEEPGDDATMESSDVIESGAETTGDQDAQTPPDDITETTEEDSETPPPVDSETPEENTEDVETGDEDVAEETIPDSDVMFADTWVDESDVSQTEDVLEEDTVDTWIEEVIPPCETPALSTTQIPLGETLFLDGDDYLAFWNYAEDCEVTLLDGPGEAVIEGNRWTPDVTGMWTFKRGEHETIVEVRDDLLNEDTFINYNYTPAVPLLLLGDDTLLATATTSNGISRVLLTEEGPQEIAFIPTGAWPTGLALSEDETMLLVTQTGRDSLGFVDLETNRLIDAIPVGDEPTGILVIGSTAWVTLMGANQVARVDLNTKEVTGLFDVGRKPRAMVADTSRQLLYVASLVSSNEHPRGPLQGDEVPYDIYARDITVLSLEGAIVGTIPHAGTIVRGLWLSEDGNTLIAGVTHARNDKLAIDADSRPHEHGLAIIDVSEGSDFPVTFLDLDKQDTSTGAAPSPFSMRTSPDEDELLITLSAGAKVLSLHPDTLEEQGRVAVGNDPRGLVFAQNRAWTYSWLDNKVVGFQLPLDEETEENLVSTIIGNDPTPEDIKEGQRIFNDGQFSKFGAFSCNNCHVDGLTDGLVWDLLVDGPVNTPAFRNIGGTGPFLWGGFLPTLFDFSREVLKLVGADATGEQMELLTIYMQSVTAPPNPYAEPGGKLSELAIAGKEVFENAAACGSCHSGPLFTNQQQVDGKTEGLVTDVPALIGVYDTPPFGRQAQWGTLDDMITFATDFTEATLTEEETNALRAYVREIPGDALYLNSAIPLNGDQHVWFEKTVELTFSNVLLPEQEALFTLETISDTEPSVTTVVPGSWSISGRVARFAPDEAFPLETKFKASVAPGLKSVMGQTLYESLHVSFRTGGLPETDVSGTWLGTIDIKQPVKANLTGEFAFLQSSGGKVSGVILVEIQEITLSHFEAVVSETTLVLDPFLLETEFGQIMVEQGEAVLEDTDGDGYADYGEGFLMALGFPIDLTFNRLKMPDGTPFNPEP